MTLSTEQQFYDLRWQDSGVSQQDRDRIRDTVLAVPPECHSILDVGCGDGRLTHALAAAGFQVTGADISSVALSRLRVPALQCSCAALKANDYAFDCVCCTEMLEHLDEVTYNQTLSEFCRVAARYILITVPNRETLGEHLGQCSCGHTFHIWGHQRSYDRPPQIAGFHVVRCNPFGRAGCYSLPLVVSMRHLFGGYAWDANTHCPKCHGTEPSAPRWSFPIKVCNFIDAKLRLTRPNWLLALYRRTS